MNKGSKYIVVSIRKDSNIYKKHGDILNEYSHNEYMYGKTNYYIDKNEFEYEYVMTNQHIDKISIELVEKLITNYIRDHQKDD